MSLAERVPAAPSPPSSSELTPRVALQLSHRSRLIHDEARLFPCLCTYSSSLPATPTVWRARAHNAKTKTLPTNKQTRPSPLPPYSRDCPCGGWLGFSPPLLLLLLLLLLVVPSLSFFPLHCDAAVWCGSNISSSLCSGTARNRSRGGGDGTRVKGRKGGLRREEELEEEGSTNSPLAPSQTVWYRVVPLLTKGRPET